MKWRALKKLRPWGYTKQHYFKTISYPSVYEFQYKLLCGIKVYGFQFGQHPYNGRNEATHRPKCKHCLRIKNG